MVRVRSRAASALKTGPARSHFETCRIEVFTLDTGRLPNETHDLLDLARDTYNVPIRVYFPDAKLAEEWVELNGTNGFSAARSENSAAIFVRFSRWPVP